MTTTNPAASDTRVEPISTAKPSPIARKLAPYYEALLSKGVAHVKITYNMGHSSCVKSGLSRKANGHLELAASTRPLIAAIAEIFYELIEARYPNCRDGRPSTSTVSWDLRTNDLVHRHEFHTIPREYAIHRGI
jgi:hypothetical protein